jgi:hypothetical protein
MKDGAVLRRRLILAGAGTLTATALALPGCTAAPATPGVAVASGPEGDPELLTNLLALEHGAVEAYEAVLARTFLGTAERHRAAAFLADHGEHAEALARALERLGKVNAGSAGSSGPPAAPILADRNEALRFLVATEQGLAFAHLAAVPAFRGRDLAKGSAGILSIESIHWAVWREALGEAPVPSPIIG